MAGTTPNRGYPYPTSGDSGDVPAAIQALAEAVDLDMQLLDESIVRRPIAVVSSRTSTAQVFPADVATEATFDFVHIDTDGITDLSAFPTRLTPTSPGMWVFWAAIENPALQSRSRDVFLRFNGGDLSRQTFHVNGSTVSASMMTNSAIALMNGTTDYFSVSFEPDGGLDDYKIRVKRMGCFRVTNA